jgi:type IV secretion system protein VirB10
MRRRHTPAIWQKPLGVVTCLFVLIAAATAQDTQPAAADADNQFRLVCAGMGFQNGYLDAYEIGFNDQRYRGRTDFSGHPLYDKADRGYNDSWIYREIYKLAYRKGFAQGYEDGFMKRSNLVVSRFAQLDEMIQQAAVPVQLPSRSDAPAAPVILPAGARVLLKLDDLLTTRMNQRGDPFTAIVVKDVFVGNALALPEGSAVLGTVGDVVPPGRIKGKAEMTLRFQKIRFKNGNEVPFSGTLTGIGGEQGQIVNEEGTYEGKGSVGRDATVVGATTGGGAVIGVIAGGGKGAAIGAAVGGLIGLAGVLSTRGEDIELTKGTLMEIMLDQDLKLDPGVASNR